MSTITTFDLDRFARAAEERDAATQLSMYGPRRDRHDRRQDLPAGRAARSAHPRGDQDLARGHLRPRHDPHGRPPRQGRDRRRLHPGVPVPRRHQRAVRDRDRARRRPDLGPDRRPGLGRELRGPHRCRPPHRQSIRPSSTSSWAASSATSAPAMSAALVVIGDKLGLYRAMARRRARSPPRSSRRAPGPTPGTSANGCPTRPPAATSATTRPASGSSCTPEQSLGARPGGQPGVRAGRVPARHLADQGRGEDRERVPDRPRGRLARAPPRPVRRHRAVLPPRLRRQPGLVVDPGARRRRTPSSKPARWSPTSAAGTAPRRS